MEKLIKHTELLVGGTLLLLAVLSGCQKDNIGDADTIPLRKITENKEYANLPLVGTKWKLLGFVDEKQKTIKLAKPDGGNSYNVVFEEGGEITATTSTGRAEGEFVLKNGKFTIQAFSKSSFNGEFDDGFYFINAMKNVQEFRITSKGLALTYDKNKYLLFHPY